MSAASMIPYASAVAALTGGLFGQGAANQEASAVQGAYQQNAAALGGLAAPYQAVGRTAFPQASALMQSQFSALDSANPFLAAQHKTNVGQIKAAGQSAQSTAKFAARYSPSMLEGGELAAKAGTTRAMTAENTGYGMAQTNDYQRRLSDFMGSLGIGINLGEEGTNLASSAANSTLQGAVQAAQIKGQGAQQMWAGAGSAVGGLSGDIEGQDDFQKYLAVMGG